MRILIADDHAMFRRGLRETLAEAFSRVIFGEAKTAAETLAVDRRKGADMPLHELLSDREFQVLRMLASGKTVKEMAEDLSLSVKTVSTYRGRILEKTGMKTNADLIRYALEAQLVDSHRTNSALRSAQFQAFCGLGSRGLLRRTIAVNTPSYCPT